MLPQLPSRIAASCAVVALFASLASCSKQKEEAPTSTFTGKVVLHDLTGALLTDYSGTVVKLYDAPSISTTTAADGTFSLANVTAGPHRLQFENYVKATPVTIIYGTYYTDEISTAAPVYALPATIHLGQKPFYTSYTVTYRSDKANQRFIINGVRNAITPNITPSQYHRVFLDIPVGYDGGTDLHYFRYSKLYRNNMPSGFSDTISFATLTAKNVRQSSSMMVTSDNPKADSCIAPFPSGFPNDNSVTFARSYPAASGTSGYIPFSWGR
jgi:hypothetical protein